MLKLILSTLLFLISFSSQSTFLTDVEIKEITAYSTNIAFIKTNLSSASTIGNCDSQNYKGEWAVPLDTDSGKAMYSLLLTAASQGKKIDISGGSVGCDLITNRETVILVKVKY